ncbi:calcium/sodium antiporter [Thorsellia kenyensis]|uniref:Calcium/sodium antiporter n=1 Tax=Thorsellia kenyensis TaxID=1549888 RepID=A0ABV6CDF8_9GAMM
MLLAIGAVVLGLFVLVWSADKFVEGASATARYFGMPPILIGMIIVGFGTSAPEMVVSLLAALEGSPGIAIGNAYGSNIVNIALILGVTALISPILVHSSILKKELPVLLAITLLSFALLIDLTLSRIDAFILIIVFILLISWSIYQGIKDKNNTEQSTLDNISNGSMSLKAAIFWLMLGLTLLIVSSRFLVWGAVEIAHHFKISDMIIGLTIVAVGTSLPELASSVIAAKKGEHDIALGNILGSNLFNTLAVVGIAGLVKPFSIDAEVLSRDMAVMLALTASLFIFCYGFKNRQGQITRLEGGILLASYIAYTAWLIFSVIK